METAMDLSLNVKRNKRLSLQVADQLLNYIHSRAMEVGERLPSERELSTLLGVCRGVVREAIAILAFKGILGVRGGAGIFLRVGGVVSPAEVDALAPSMETLEGLSILQSEVAAIAVDRVGREQIVKLRSLIERMEAPENTTSEVNALILEFHLQVARASGNRVLVDQVTWMWQLLTDNLRQKMHRAFIESDQFDLSYHRLILGALIQRNPRLAREKTKEHVQQMIDELTFEEQLA